MKTIGKVGIFVQNTLWIGQVLRYDTKRQCFVSGSVTVSGGRITALDAPAPTDAERIDGAGQYLMPGLVDVHTHGRIGFDFDSADEKQMQKMYRSYVSDGTTTVIPTIASAPFSQMLQALERIRACGCFPAAHLEGRYLSPKRRGAHRVDLLANPDIDELHTLLEHITPLPLHITLAPELPGANEFIREALRLGVTVSMGHSDATYEQAQTAFANGINAATHLCNAMAPLHHRAPGNICAALCDDHIYTELICDGLHVHPGMVQMIHKLKPSDRLVLITDSMSATRCADGNYSIAGMPVVVKDGKALTVDGALAGSTITLLDGLKHLMDFCHIPVEQALPCATINPARMLGLDQEIGSIEVGKQANFLLCKDNFSDMQVILNGQRVTDA